MTTIRDVARYLGVSVSTVSRYLNHHPDLNEETRQRIEQAIKELDYVPSTAARNVSRLSTHTIGLTIPDIQDSFFADNASGVDSVARENGFSVIYGSMNRKPERMLEFVQYAREMRFDGLIITPDAWTDDLLRLLRRVNIPVIALRRRPPEDAGIPYVDTDNYSGACQMVDYLCDLGHRSISHIVLNTDIGREHLRGYTDSMLAHGLTPVSLCVPEQPANRIPDAIVNGREAMSRLWARHPETTAVFASSDPLAIGAMEYLTRQGLRVPQDISVSGRGDIELASLYWFQLTTISFDRYELGRQAAQMLFKMIRKEVDHPKSVLFRTHLVVRGSTKNLFDSHPSTQPL